MKITKRTTTIAQNENINNIYRINSVKYLGVTIDAFNSRWRNTIIKNKVLINRYKIKKYSAKIDIYQDKDSNIPSIFIVNLFFRYHCVIFPFKANKENQNRENNINIT